MRSRLLDLLAANCDDADVDLAASMAANKFTLHRAAQQLKTVDVMFPKSYDLVVCGHGTREKSCNDKCKGGHKGFFTSKINGSVENLYKMHVWLLKLCLRAELTLLFTANKNARLTRYREEPVVTQEMLDAVTTKMLKDLLPKLNLETLPPCFVHKGDKGDPPNCELHQADAYDKANPGYRRSALRDDAGQGHAAVRLCHAGNVHGQREVVGVPTAAAGRG